MTHYQTKCRVHLKGRKPRSRETKMIQLDSIGNILNDVPNNSMMRLSAIVKGCLIMKFPDTVQNGLNKINNNRAIPRNARRKTQKENRNAIWNKRRRRGQQRRKERDKESPNELNTRTIQKPMIYRLPAQAGCTPVRRDVTPITQRITNFNGFKGYKPGKITFKILCLRIAN